MGTEKAQDRAILVGLHSPCLSPEEDATEETLEELSALVETAGGLCLGTMLQNRPTPDYHTFIGTGKTEEVRELVQAQGANLVIFDNPLSPSQQRSLSEEIGVGVIDRAGLILDIFAQRAQSSEGRLQVELAQCQYLLPRLTGMWKHLERQSGGIGTRGPGETQLESDRRMLRHRISKLKEELEQVRRVRATQRQQREKNEVPVVALVGYTNAGKSTLLNQLTQAAIPANNRLFDTLDTTTRARKIGGNVTVLFSDTVGFIQKLPHHLVDAFQATLEELTYADLLLHVIDVSNPRFPQQMEVVENLMEKLGAQATPRINVYNKSDLFTGDFLPQGEGCACISAKTGEGVEKLLEQIEAKVATTRLVQLRLPYDQGQVLDTLYRQAEVLDVRYEEAILVQVRCPANLLGKLRPYLVDEG